MSEYRIPGVMSVDPLRGALNSFGWLVGNQQPPDSPFYSTTTLIKIDRVKKGQRRAREDASAEQRNTTIQYVVSGRVRTSFLGRTEAEDDHYEVGPGQALCWVAGRSHYWEILEDGEVLTFRYPKETFRSE